MMINATKCLVSMLDGISGVFVDMANVVWLEREYALQLYKYVVDNK